MSLSKKHTKKIKNFKRRQARTRATIVGSENRLRLSVYRSNKYISAQIIDDAKGQTLVAVQEKELDIKSRKATKTERAELVGKLIAKKAGEKKITKVTFDRSGYNYHGRVKALADGARAGGLKF